MVATKSATVSGQLRPIVKSFTQKPAQCSRICGNWMPRHAGSTTEARTVKAVYRVDALPTKTSAAADNLRSAGLADHVTLTTAAGVDSVEGLPDGSTSFSSTSVCPSSFPLSNVCKRSWPSVRRSLSMAALTGTDRSNRISQVCEGRFDRGVSLCSELSWTRRI